MQNRIVTIRDFFKTAKEDVANGLTISLYNARQS